MPLSESRVKQLEENQSRYGCGNPKCVPCYPVQYACENCGEQYRKPIANGEIYTCEHCEYVANGEDENV